MYVSDPSRGVPILAALLILAASGGAEPGAVVVLEEHPTGADLVRITLVDPAADPSALRARLEGLRPAPRGLSVGRDPTAPNATMDRPGVRADFAVDGWLEGRLVKLDGLVRALCSPGPGRLSELRVVVTKFRPGPDILRNFSQGGLAVKGSPTPDGAEYAVLAAEGWTGQVPVAAVPQAPVAAPPVEPESPPSSALPYLAIPALAAGALVYSLILRRRGSVHGDASRNAS